MFRFLIIAVGVFFALPAQALHLKNCDDQPHTVQVDYYGEVVELTLEPGQRRYLSGRAREMTVGGKTTYFIRWQDEYCIRDGKLSLQRRKRNNKHIR